MNSTAPDAGSYDPAARLLLAKCAPGLALGLALSFAISLTMFIPPLYMLKLFSDVTTSGSIATVTGLSILALGAVLLFCVLDYLRHCTYHRLAAWFALRLGEQMLEPIAARALDRSETATGLIGDVNLVRDFVSGGALTAGLELVWTPMFFFALFLLHPYFGWLGLASGAGLLTLAIVNELLTRRAAAETTARAGAAYREIGSALNFPETLEAMGMLRRLGGRWRKLNLAMITANIRCAHRHSISMSAAKGLRMSLQIAVFGGGMLLVIDQSASVGTLIAASIILVRALAPLEQLLDRWRLWGAAGGAMRRLSKALDMPPRIVRGTMTLPRPCRSLDLKRVVFVPPGSRQPVIRGVSLHLEFGSFVCIAGAAAAGKTTLLKLIAGMWVPSAGALTLDGHDTHSWNRENFGRHVGYLPQSLQLFGPSVRAAITRLSEDTSDQVIEAARRAGIHDAIGRLPKGYDTDLDTALPLLSDGQRQQLAIARAFYGSPALLLLDEPDASLDQAAAQALAASLRAFARQGHLVLVSSHRTDMLRAADTVVLLDQGSVLKIASPRPVSQQRELPLQAIPEMAPTPETVEA
ncbi:ATP-binding cassette domain-containing protein [Nisaea acidiphila]|uniref:ATP-binding cassette domain-containing protein n=1 Tax=Nisaea acidiphila TaxID=1862145 RepID=A0A9J7AYF3_9PROT|nr:ATP-binding cassette domain-containing protein [Nisaea acidiphila]UUX51300.1 ATP-binding cassette domain-containing protein [Nisaea acidiphila]